jgi:hypothetical protein
MMRTFFKVLLVLIWIVAFAKASGQATFIRTYDLPPNATITSLAATAGGGMVITGHVDETGLVYRLDGLGNIIWSKRYTDLGDLDIWGGGQDPHGIIFSDAVAVNDGIVVIGSSIDHTTGNPYGSTQRLILKLNVSGEVQWIKHDGSYLWGDDYKAVERYDQTSVVAVGYRGGIGGGRGWLSKIDHGTGEQIDGTSAYRNVSSSVTQGNFRYVHCLPDSTTIALGERMLIAFDHELDTLWTLGAFDQLKGLHVFADGSGVMVNETKLTGFTANGTVQYVKMLMDADMTFSSMIGDESGNIHVVGNNDDGSVWHASLDASGNVQWTRTYDLTSAASVVADMTMLVDGRIAIVSWDGDASEMNLIVTNSGATQLSCAGSNASIAMTTSMNDPAMLIYIIDQMGGSAGVLFPGTVSEYCQNEMDCSNGLFMIAGNAYIDANENGDLDAGEDLVNDRMIMLQPNGTSAWTGADGYSFIVSDTGTYVIVHEPLPYWELTEGAAGHTITITETDTVFTGLDFGLTPLMDTTVVIGSIVQGPLQCDQITEQYITVQNLGTTEPDLLVTITFDPLLTFQNAQPAPDSTSVGVLYYSIDEFDHFQEQMITLQFIAPDFNSMGDSLSSQLQVFDITGGTLVNEYSTNTVVTCSYDPNDKLVNPVGEGIHGGIDEDVEWLDYTIRFQNTGNDTATTVMIADQLDPHLDHTSIQILGQSHPLMYTTMSAGGLIEFRFEGIMLPDSATDPLGSQGFIQFRIDLLPDLPVGTAITNNAGIFFDQNPAVITNTVINTIRDCTLDQPALTIQSVTYDENTWLNAVTAPPIYVTEGSHTYTWFLNGDQIYTSQFEASLFVTEEGIYTVQVTDPVGCILISEPYPLIGLSIADEVEAGITVRPNPFSEGTLIEFAHVLDSGTIIELLDVQGRIVRSEGSNGSKQFYLERGDLEAGIYLVRIWTGDGYFISRLVAE